MWTVVGRLGGPLTVCSAWGLPDLVHGHAAVDSMAGQRCWHSEKLALEPQL